MKEEIRQIQRETDLNEEAAGRIAAARAERAARATEAAPLAVRTHFSPTRRTFYVSTEADPTRFASVYRYAPGALYNVVPQVPERVPADLCLAPVPPGAADALRRYYIQPITISPVPDARLWMVKTTQADDPEADSVESLRLDDVLGREGALWRLAEMMADGDSLTFTAAQALTTFRINCEDFREND
jgi:hypothetical protein